MIKKRQHSSNLNDASDEVLLIEDLPAVKALFHPLRFRIVVLLDEPRSVKEVARSLGVKATRLYHHFRVLSEHGLIAVADSRIVSGIEEKRYRAASVEIPSSPELELQAAHMLRATMASGAYEVFLREPFALIERSFRQAPSAGSLEGLELGPLVIWKEWVLAKDRLAEFHERLSSLVDEFAEAPVAESENPRPHRFFSVLFPEPQPDEESTDASAPREGGGASV